MRTIQQRYLLTALFILLSGIANTQPVRTKDPAPSSEQSIMLALLLDTSNSMDGLIEQAKSQLWKIVNELAKAKCGNGAHPKIQIALYEYGNDGLSAAQGYIRQVCQLTSDLDLISEKLFSLRTNGGSEYCGQVIKTSLNQLNWSSSGADLKMIFIAGNEPFTQGEIPYRVACALAKEKDVVVNTIFCGDFNEGIRTEWKNGADATGGTYMSIQQDSKTVYIQSPFDEQIDALNGKLNETYVFYGSEGYSKKELQTKQDDNAMSYSRSNKVERAISKSSSAYTNSSWDLVDAASADEKVIGEASDKELPAEMKGMTVDQRRAYIKSKSDDRKAIQMEIQKLSNERAAYIRKSSPKTEKASLDDAMLKAIRDRAKAKQMTL
jgi:hypothetical protein